ncbi:MAG: efflux RND transporter permease subunit, partial [Alphaproteobacteria bacterium]|nr:efflux RND transporter permease subunit [Alphaproteobacteria bacterium]
DKYDKDTLPQVWDELRRKIKAAAQKLPPGAGQPQINDDFGDVYGIFFAITGDGYNPHDLKEIAKDLRRELLLCDNVGRIDFWGKQPEVVYVEIDRTKLAQLGLPPTAIFNTIKQQNTVTPAGNVNVGSENAKFRVTGTFKNVKDLGELLIQGGKDGRMIRLKDVAHIERGYLDPPMELLSYNGKDAIGLGISTVSGGNVVTMGNAVKKRLENLEERIPVGVKIHKIAYQSDTVKTAVNGFILNLIEAVSIVILLLMIFMGKREGFIIGAILLLTILCTFICMQFFEINFQRISLGALIIAMGMLVDNAIVVTEGIVIKSQKGIPRIQAAEETVKETQYPLLGATIIAIIAFAAISLSKDITGEFLGSLFKVIGISLGLSWIFAVTVTPFFCVNFLPPSSKSTKDPYDNYFYNIYRQFLEKCIDKRWLFLMIVCGVLFASMYGFKFVKKSFFPDSTRPQFTVSVWYPEGTNINHTTNGMIKVENFIKKLDGVTNTSTFIGRGALRFILTYNPEMPNSAYGQILVSVDDYYKIENLIPTIETYLNKNLNNAVTSVDAFKLGLGGSAVEVRINGTDRDKLRSLAEQIKNIMA